MCFDCTCHVLYFLYLMIRRPPRSTRTDTLFPYTTLFLSAAARLAAAARNDLTSPVPKDVRRDLPNLASAMENLFGQFRSNLKNAQTLALYDPVTSIPKRTSFCRQVERLLAARPADGHAALFFIDLDGFKMVNDTLGHAAGDQWEDEKSELR